MTVSDQELFQAARRVREQAHAPYSGYRVGAAIVDTDGGVHTGCNVENAAFPVGICAETNAIGSMVAAGGRRIARIAVVGGGQTVDACTPCGACRQSILEFADDATQVLLLDGDGSVVRFAIAELLPHAFKSL